MAKWAVLGRHEKEDREGLAGKERCDFLIFSNFEPFL